MFKPTRPSLVFGSKPRCQVTLTSKGYHQYYVTFPPVSTHRGCGRTRGVEYIFQWLGSQGAMASGTKKAQAIHIQPYSPIQFLQPWSYPQSFTTSQAMKIIPKGSDEPRQEKKKLYWIGDDWAVQNHPFDCFLNIKDCYKISLLGNPHFLWFSLSHSLSHYSPSVSLTNKRHPNWCSSPDFCCSGAFSSR